jgi:DNA-directed RNA polymerase specialized sigma24 family protein
LTAETFACALEGRRRFDRRRGEAGAWLFGIARNVLSRSLEGGRVEDDAADRVREARRLLAYWPRRPAAWAIGSVAVEILFTGELA